MATRRGPRYRTSGQMDSTALESFREHVGGYGNRIPLRNVGAMQAGEALSPHGLVRRYLVAARSIGLPKAWALKFYVWVGRQIDCLWPQDQTPLRVLQERALLAESADDLAEKRCDLERNAITLREQIRTKTEEVTFDMLVLAKLEREMEAL